MSEWLKVEWGEDRAQTWIRADMVQTMTVIDDGDTLETTGPMIAATFRGVKSARFVNTTEDGPNNYFVSRSCGGCE